MTLTLTKSTAIGQEYAGSDGGRYLLRPVDREFAGTAKKPVYYLERLTGGKPVYLSGLFATPAHGVFSLDLKDSFGVRVLHTLTLRDGGKVAELKKGKAQKTA